MPNIVKPTGLNTLWAAGGTKNDPGTSKVNIGWVVELPPYQYQNWLDNRQDTFIAHVNQHGIPEWDAETEYQGNLSYSQGSDGIIYKCIQTHTNLNPTNPLNSLYWTRAFEVYGSVAVVQAQLTSHLTNYATLSGIANPVAARANLSVWSRTESDARYAMKAGDNTQVFAVATATQPQHAVPLGQIQSLLLGATESSAGVIQIATVGETETGTNDTKAVSPLKGATVYLKKSDNLAGLTNVATARSNLGLGTAATASVSDFLAKTNNLSDLSNVPAARTNLGLTSIVTQPETVFLKTANNLSDVSNPATTRNNLGLTSTATTALATIMLKADNLSGLSNVATARSNLGLGDIATMNASAFLRTTNNLSDLSNVQAARNNLGLGSAATRDVAGFAGPIDFTGSIEQNGWTRLPNGLIIQWGLSAFVPADNGVSVTFPIPFPNNCFTVNWTQDAGFNVQSRGNYAVTNVSKTSFYIVNGADGQGPCYWTAFGN